MNCPDCPWFSLLGVPDLCKPALQNVSRNMQQYLSDAPLVNQGGSCQSYSFLLLDQYILACLTKDMAWHRVAWADACGPLWKAIHHMIITFLHSTILYIINNYIYYIYIWKKTCHEFPARWPTDNFPVAQNRKHNPGILWGSENGKATPAQL